MVTQYLQQLKQNQNNRATKYYIITGTSLQRSIYIYIYSINKDEKYERHDLLY